MTVETDAVRSGVNREKRITEMKLKRYREKVRELEEEHGMDSDEFRERYKDGELEDSQDFMKWDVYLDIIEDLEEKKEDLSRFHR